MTIDTISPNNRARALLYYFGMGLRIGGETIPELARLTGCSAADLLHAAELPYSGGLASAHVGGFSAVRTCSMEWRRDTLAPRYVGNLEYWQGVIAGFWVTGALEVAQ